MTAQVVSDTVYDGDMCETCVSVARQKANVRRLREERQFSAEQIALALEEQAYELQGEAAAGWLAAKVARAWGAAQ